MKVKLDGRKVAKAADDRARLWRRKQKAAAPGGYYGDGGTIHGTSTIDVVVEGGVVREVWFRCQQLPFSVSTPKGNPVYGGADGLPRLTGVEVIDPT